MSETTAQLSAIERSKRIARRAALATTAGIAAAQTVAVGTLLAMDAYTKRGRKKRRAPKPGTFDSSVEKSDITIFTSGEELYDSMIESIDNAEHTVMLSTFIWKGDRVGQRFMDAVNNAAARGVNVFLIWDVFANLVVPRQFFEQLDERINVHRMYPISESFWRAPIRSTGLLHSKVLVVDDEIGYVGGFNIGDAYESEWRDTHVREVGPAVWELRQAFVNVWNEDRRADERIDWIAPNAWNTRVEVHPNLPLQAVYPIRRMYLAAIERAQKNIWLSTPYFVPDGKLLEPLRAAAARGVDVRLMLPEQSNHVVVDWVARGFYQDLLDAGVRIFLYTPAMNHSKIATIDGMWATVGTANLDRLSLALNYETNLEVADPAFAEALEKVFEADFKDCFEVDPEKWKARAGIEKVTEKLLVPLRPIM